MPDGYLRGGKPDVGWWMEQVQAGIDYRKKRAYQSDWARWRDYYRGNWSRSVMPVNLFFTMVRTVVPRVYFRNPSVSVTQAMPGPEVMAFARALEKIDNRMLLEMGAKKQFKKIIQQAFLFGTGVGKLGFGAVHQPSPELGETGQPITVQGERFEYKDRVYQNMPWFSHVKPKDFIVPKGLEDWEDARWCGHWVKRPLADVKADPRFKNTSDLGATHIDTEVGSIHHTEDMIDLVEVRDKKMNRVHVFVPYGGGGGRELYTGDDEFLNNGAFNFYPVVFNYDDEYFWGLPDSKILEPYQLEINEINTQIMKHRRLTLIKMLVKRGAIKEEEIAKMYSEDVLAAISVDGDVDADVKIQQAGDIPQGLIIADRHVMERFRETVGFSRNQMGEYKPGSSDTTATEAKIVMAATEIRVDERRDIVADAIVDMVEGMHSIIFNHWTDRQVVEVLGPGGVPIWLIFQGSLAKQGRYLTRVDPDSAVPETREVRRQRAERIYALLQNNPTVDPFKLTEWLLNEEKGVTFDDVMKALPAPEQAPNGPITARDFGGLVQNSLGRMGGSAPGSPSARMNRGNGTSAPLERGDDRRAGGNGISQVQ